MSNEAIFTLIPDASARLVDCMADGPWPDQPARHLRWTPREIATHLATVIDYFDAMLDAGSTVPGLAALETTNQAGLAQRRARPWSDVIDEVRAGTARVTVALASLPADVTLRWHGGIEISPRTAAGVLAGELLIHEWDLAHTLRRPTLLTAPDARVALAAVIAAMPHVLDTNAAAGRRAHLRIRIRGSETFDLRIVDAAMTVTEPAGRADCHVSAEPVSFFLLAYKRRSIARVAATGGSVVWGRRPWQAFTLPRLLDVP